MELQELALKALGCQLRYELTPRYPDVRGRLAEEVIERFDVPQWGWGDQFLNFGNEEQSRVLIAGGQEVRAQINRVSDISETVAMIGDFFALALDILDVKEVSFVGARSYWAAAVSSFDELREWMLNGLGSSVLNDVSGQVGGKLTDIGWVLEFMDQDPKHRLALGPMTREQLLERVLPSATSDDIPDAFLFIDFDRIYNETEHDRGQALEKWRNAVDRNLEIVHGLGGVLTGERAIS
jgi:hypothetical protein